MKACIVFAHEGKESFCHAILDRVTRSLQQQQIDFEVRDLYQMKFQPVFDAADMQKVANGSASQDVATEQELISDADLLVMIYPVWWWSPPAILKGYIDRVFTNNFAFRYDANGPVGLLSNKQAIVFTTTRESEAEMQTSGFDAVVKKQIVDGTLAMIGYDVTYRNFAAVPYVDNAAREQMLAEVEKIAASARQPLGV
ncbi:NAD(P)H dehydrogenase [Brevibacillus agri]|uniref:Flavodoxin family protein n=1 Tax=Brevibacillus agri TaxID=51101 RepID=A0A3M8B4N3_9BACL|nr:MULTISPECIES: NAD(P)H-dependent oxidoreductase [Brevibacillus]EJL41168.1 putative NADPH-quinone reductase (modulator of drug activity B) [Brevibacillus sp. CF112]MBG9569016.1 NAD(P)H dehydrogenase [Brevibacillus agri]MCG5252876.1 NAD(P)H-dependent oxidoreductase [Brevibacillus agri]QAV14602.1 flavodoxin family protein [Brevibacillus agri]QHZ57242.1 NAD(P)H-dependent oxidoreductase [Brevibacillus sp. NSP2.1]